MLPKSIQNAINELSRLPGIGSKTAQRLAMYLLRDNKKLHRDLGSALLNLTEGVEYCEDCYNLSEGSKCYICLNPNRDSSMICVVEDALDVVSIENTRMYKGLYHVLHGALAPIDGVGPDDIKVKELEARVCAREARAQQSEIILATNPRIEGEATAFYIQSQLSSYKFIKITRIAQGIPMGSELEYADYLTLSRAMEGRRLI